MDSDSTVTTRQASAHRYAAFLPRWPAVSAEPASWQGRLGAPPAGGAPALATAHAPRDGRRSAVRTGACAGLAVPPAVTAAAIKVSVLTGGGIPL
ncbi:hypothetical protein ACVV2G_02600 [Streptomyces ziwulingensis]